MIFMTIPAEDIMSRGKASGYTLKASDASIILGMAARNDRDHDIAAWFGVNQGRIAEVKDGKFGTPPIAPSNQLPPKGPPGIKGRRLRQSVSIALALLAKNSASLKEVTDKLSAAAKQYDANET
jgi:hypothetical protein